MAGGRGRRRLVVRRLRLHEEAPFEYPARLGRWRRGAAAVVHALELTYLNLSTRIRSPWAIAIYSVVTWSARRC